MIFLIKAILFLFSAAMAGVGIFFTSRGEENEYIRVFKILFLVFAAIVFIVVAIKELRNFLDSAKGE